MAISPFISDSRQAFVDLAGSLCFDDEDPVYPYVPPTIEDSIDQLASRPPHSFESLTLSLPTEPRSLSNTKATHALARLLSSPACVDLVTIRIAGDLRLLNDNAFQAALGSLKIRSFVLQEPQALVDSYALAATLSAVNGISDLHLALSSSYSGILHTTFVDKTKDTFSRIKNLKLTLKGVDEQRLANLFAPDSLPSLETLDLCFENTTWPTEATSILQRAACASPLSTINITRSASDSRVGAVCDVDTLLPLLTIPTLRHISLVAENPNEGLKLVPTTIDALTSDLKSLRLVYAAPSDLMALYYELQNRLASFSQLEHVHMVHSYPERGLSEDDSEDWEIVRVAAGHPAAARKEVSATLSRLADELELANVSYRLKLTGSKFHEERASLSERSRTSAL